MARNSLGYEFGGAARLFKRPGSVWNCLWGTVLKISPGIIRKSRVLYPDPGFLASSTWPLLPKKHSNGLINQSYHWYHLPSHAKTKMMLIYRREHLRLLRLPCVCQESCEALPREDAKRHVLFILRVWLYVFFPFLYKNMGFVCRVIIY